MNSNTDDFEEKEKRFFQQHGIKINPKTGNWNKEFYIDENLKFKLGRIPPMSIIVQGKTVYLCKFCQSPLNEIEYKGHDKEFCNSKCQQNYFQTTKTYEKLHRADPNITMIMRYPQKEKPEEAMSKTKPIKKNQMNVTYKDLTKKPYSDIIKRGRPKTKTD